MGSRKICTFKRINVFVNDKMQQVENGSRDAVEDKNKAREYGEDAANGGVVVTK